MATKKIVKKPVVVKNAMREAALAHEAAMKKAAVKKAAKNAAKVAPKKKKAAPSTKPAGRKRGATPKGLAELQSMRGVATFDTEEALVLIRATVEKVAKAYSTRAKLKTWVKHAVGKKVTVGTASFLVYQLKTHPWVTIDGFGKSHVSASVAKRLSKSLSTQTIFYGNSDTACVTTYEMFDDGKRLEYFETGDEGVVFESKLRDEPPPEDGPDVETFVNDFIEKQDAFIPGWSSLLFNSWRYKIGDEVSLAFGEVLNDETIERFDFISD